MKQLIVAMALLVTSLIPAYADAEYHNWPDRSDAAIVCQERINNLTLVMSQVYDRLYYLDHTTTSEVVDSLFIFNFRYRYELEFLEVIEILRWNGYQENGASECIRISDTYWRYMHDIISNIPDFF